MAAVYILLLVQCLGQAMYHIWGLWCHGPCLGHGPKFCEKSKKGSSAIRRFPLWALWALSKGPKGGILFEGKVFLLCKVILTTFLTFNSYFRTFTTFQSDQRV